MNKRCSTCKYRSGDHTVNDCDYAGITGRTRTAQVQRSSQLLPKNCPFYEKGERQDRLTHINLEDRVETMERNNRRRLEAFDKAALMAAYREGMNDHEIAERVGATVNLVSYWRRQNELPRNEGKRRSSLFSDQYFLELYQAGLNDVEIAEKLGCHKSTTGDYRRKLGLPPNIKTKFDEAELIRLYNEGMSDGEIGRRLGFSRDIVGRYRKEKGLVPNPRSVPIDGEQVRKLYEADLNDKQIANITGVSKHRILEFRKKNNMPAKFTSGGKLKCN